MARQYRVGAFVRFNNAFMRSLLRTFAVLVVRGRKSGRQIQTPLVVFHHGESRYLVATYGVFGRPADAPH